MKSNYELLGNHIRLVDSRNSNSITERVLGISIDKEFMPSVANVIGTDLSKYKLITKGVFACNPMHVGRDERLPVALYTEEEPAIVSPAYFMFEIKDTTILNNEFLMMWFRRPEFDRECWFKTDGSVRGGITWDDICRIELPVPPYEKQLEIVKSYKAITERIALKKKINDNLEAQVQAAFNAEFVAFENNDFDLVETKIGEIPSNMTVKLVSDINPRIESGKRPSGGALSSGFPSLGADCAKGLGCYDKSKAKYVPEDFAAKMTKGIVRGYELLAYKDGGKPSEFVPDFTIFGEGYPFNEFAINEHVFLIDFGTPEANWFSYFMFKSPYVYNLLASVGGKSAIPGINQQDIGALYFIDPFCEPALAFGKRFLPVLKSILLNCKEILQLNELKNNILTVLSR